MKTNAAQKVLDAIPESVETDRGYRLAVLLGLKEARDQHGKKFSPPRYNTEFGTKTALGLFRTIAAVTHGL